MAGGLANQVEIFNEKMGAAHKSAAAGNLEEAKGQANAALAHAQGLDAEVSIDLAREAKGLVQDLEERIKYADRARGEWEEFKKAFDDSEVRGAKTWNDMYNWAHRLKKDYEGQNWQGELSQCLETIDRNIAEGTAEAKGKKFQPARADIEKRYIKGGKNQWGPAIKAWQRYIKRIKISGDKGKARKQIKILNSKANGEIRKLQTKVRNKSVRAGWLKRNRSRFEGTDHLEKYEALVKKAGG